MSSSVSSSSDSWVIEEATVESSNPSAPHLLSCFNSVNSTPNEMERQNQDLITNSSTGTESSDGSPRAMMEATLATLRSRIQELRHDQREFQDMYDQCTIRLSGQNLNAAQQKVFENNQSKARKSLDTIEQAIQNASERLQILEAGGHAFQGGASDVAEPTSVDDSLTAASLSETTLIASNEGDDGAKQPEADAEVDEEAIAAEQAALAALKLQISSLRSRIADLQTRQITAADEERLQDEMRQELQQAQSELQPTSSRRAAEIDVLRQDASSTSGLKADIESLQRVCMAKSEEIKLNETQQSQVPDKKNKNTGNTLNAFLPFHHPLAGAASSGNSGGQFMQQIFPPFPTNNNFVLEADDDGSDASENVMVSNPPAARNNNSYRADDADLSFVSIRNQTDALRQPPATRGAPQIRLPDYYPSAPASAVNRSAAANKQRPSAAVDNDINNSAMQTLMGHQQMIRDMLNELNTSSAVMPPRAFPPPTPAFMPPLSPYLPIQYHPSNIGLDGAQSRWQLATQNMPNNVMNIPYGFTNQQLLQMMPYQDFPNSYTSPPFSSGMQPMMNYSPFGSFSPTFNASPQQQLLQQQKLRLEETMRQLNDLMLTSSGAAGVSGPAASNSSSSSGVKPKNTRSTKNRDSSNIQQQQQSGRNAGGSIVNQWGNDLFAANVQSNNSTARASQRAKITDRMPLSAKDNSTMPKTKASRQNEDGALPLNQLRTNSVNNNVALPSNSFAAPLSNNINNAFARQQLPHPLSAARADNIAQFPDMRTRGGAANTAGSSARGSSTNNNNGVNKNWIKAYAVGSRGQLRPIYVLPKRIVGAVGSSNRLTTMMPRGGAFADANNADGAEPYFQPAASRRNKHLKRSAEAEDLVFSSSPRSLARPNYFGFGNESSSTQHRGTNNSLAEYRQPLSANVNGGELDIREFLTLSPQTFARNDRQHLTGFTHNNANAGGSETAELNVDEELLESLDPTSAQRIMGMFAASRLMSLCADVVAAYGTDAVCLDETLTALKHLNTPASRRVALEQLKKIEAMASFGHHGATGGTNLFRGIEAVGSVGNNDSSRNRARSGGALQEPQQLQAITKVASGVSGMNLGGKGSLLPQQQQRSRESISPRAMLDVNAGSSGSSNNNATDELDDKRAKGTDTGKADTEEQSKMKKAGAGGLGGSESSA